MGCLFFLGMNPTFVVHGFAILESTSGKITIFDRKYMFKLLLVAVYSSPSLGHHPPRNKALLRDYSPPSELPRDTPKNFTFADVGNWRSGAMTTTCSTL